MEKKVTKKPARKTAKPAKTTKKVVKAVSKKTKPAVTKKTTTKKAPKVKAEKANDKMDLFFRSRIIIFAQTTTLTVISALGFAACGYYLDKALGTSPLMLTAALIVGYPATLALLFIRFKRFAKNKLNEVKK